MKKYQIITTFFILLCYNTILGQAAGFTTAIGFTTSTTLPIFVHGNTPAADMVYLGHGAGSSIPLVTQSTGVGFGVLVNNIGGQSNTALGFRCLASNTSNPNGTVHGSFNTAVGANSLLGNTLGSNNTAVGFNSLTTNSTSQNNVAIGFQALTISNSNSNVAIGSGALMAQTSGDGNTAVGFNALTANQTGRQNVAMGIGAMSAVTSGTSNVGLGFGAGPAITTGNRNVTLGAGATVTNANDQLSIQNVINGINMTGVGGGNVGIGVVPAAATTARLQVGGILRVDVVNNVVNPGKRFLWRDANDNNLIKEDLVPNGNVNSCALVNYLPKTNNANGNMDCSIINQVSSNIGIDVPTPISKLDINCTANLGNGHIRLRNLTQWPLSDPQPTTNFLLIDSNGDLWKSNNMLSKGQAGSPTIDIDQNEIIHGQQIKIANLETEIADLKNKINQLVPGCITVKDDNFRITPNPVTGTSTISYKMDPTITNAVFIVYDLQGKMLKKYAVDKNVKEGQVQLSKKDFGNGMYILSLVSNNLEIQSKHFIIAE